MQNSTKCPHCGANMKAYWHSLTQGLVDTLSVAYRTVGQKQENVFDIGDLGLTKYQYNNFQKLRFHALIAKYREDGKHISGKWVITRRGFLFMQNKLQIPDRVLTYRNRVIDHSTKMKSIVDIYGSKPYFEKEFNFEIQQPKYIGGHPIDCNCDECKGE